MNIENVGLSRSDRINWIVNMLACSGEQYEFIVNRLNQLSTPNLLRLDVVATIQGETLCKMLLTEDDMELILAACRLAPKHDHHHNVADIKEVMRAVTRQGYTLGNIAVHLDARSAYRRAVGSTSHYTDNLALVSLVERHPLRMLEIMDFIQERGSSDADLVSDYLQGAAPLSEGTL